MGKSTTRLAVFPGSFDPLTYGHVDLIRRGAEIFDELIVAVSVNPRKTPFLPPADRLAILRQALARFPNVRVEAFSGLTADFARRRGAGAILRGVRDAADLHGELQMAFANRTVSGVDTVFLPASPQHAFTSSTLVRQIAGMGGDVSALVPPEVLARLRGARAKAKGRRRRQPP